MTPGEAFGKRLSELRAQRNLTASQLAERMFVSKSTVSRWENGTRQPDLGTLSRLAACLSVPYGVLLDALSEPGEPPTVLLFEHERLSLQDSLDELSAVLPEASIFGFTGAAEALLFARSNWVDLAFLGIEQGEQSGFKLCEELCELNPRLNVIFLSSYPGYAQDAWSTEASGFLLKPLRRDALLVQLRRLRYPIPGLVLPPPRFPNNGKT